VWPSRWVIKELCLPSSPSVPNRVVANGFVLEGWGFNIIRNGVKIMMYEGQDKYDEFVTQLQAIKQELRE
jgi:hypothetical protein